MSHQTAPDMQPRVRKAGQQHDEMRDTPKPCMVTEHLMSFVRAAGKPTEVSTIWKNTRDEVLLLDGLQPWRRSPLWLVVRVALQLRLARSASLTGAPIDLYKPFMIFFMAGILDLSHTHTIQSDVLFCMDAKLCRRMRKLDAEQIKPWIHTVASTMTSTHGLIERRWRDIAMQTCPNLDLRCLESLKYKDDTAIDLRNLDDHITAMIRREHTPYLSSFQPVCALPRYSDEDLPSGFSDLAKEYQTSGLAALEDWVERDLLQWLDSHISEETTCGRLRSLIESYHTCAASHYANNPEGTSIMFLTVIELWIACDKSACVLHDMLSDYSTEIPVEVLQSLILPSKSQMQRLSTVEQYLRDRQSKASGPSLFYSFGQPSAFSARYFNQSLHQQDLLSKIVQKASREREEKCVELSQKKSRYEELMRLYHQSDCESYETIVDSFNDFRETRHSGSCKKCSYKSSAESIGICVHEWPLPSDSDKAKSVVFELQAPVAFCQWRDTTVYLLTDILGCKYTECDRPRAKYTPQNYQGLQSFYKSTILYSQRVGLLSQVKPHTGTHRKNKHIVNVKETEVCLENGLQFQYYDCVEGVFSCTFHTTDKVLGLCTYRLPERSSALQKFLMRPPSMPNGLSPNFVIASQSDCPAFMSLNEFKAFSALPFGYRIQWRNVLLQLSIPSVDFTKMETTMMLLQVIHQAGLAGEGGSRRASHEDLADESFGRVLLLRLREALQWWKENWDAYQALASFINVTARLLSLASSSIVHDECLKCLADVRKIAFGWVDLLRDKSQQSTEQAHRTELLSKAVDVALICVNTFNVDQHHLEDILSASSEASTFLQSSIFIRENIRSLLGQSAPLHVIMLARWEKLCYRATPVITREVMERASPCLDDAIKSSWSDYEAGSTWQSVANPHEHWLIAGTASQHGSQALSVHFNLVTAELLVNGLPLARLPSNYENHPMYLTLFGRSTLEIMPTSVPGMKFSAKKAYAGHTIHFAMHSKPQSDLVLQAVQSGRRYDLLPSRMFRDQLPTEFVDKFVHWYDHADRSIEIRPIENPWSSSPANWRLTKVDSSWHLSNSDLTLISVSSATARALSDILRPLATPLNIHVFFHDASRSLEIDLPKLQLGFYLQPGSSRMYSRQSRGMYIDPNQSIGTLVGLQNKLVLKQGHHRVVAIPEGQVSYQRTPDHISISIDLDFGARVHTFQIDERLGRLVDDGSMQSKLFVCYLHGLSSYCLPDPLTAHTGTEQALLILNSAAVRSFDYLRESSLAILKYIAELVPGRRYYPANARVMQTIDWDYHLSFLSQHGSFYKSVRAIFEQANDTKFFYPETYIEPPKLDFLVPHLLERDLIRSSTFRVSDFGAEQHTVEYDAEYHGRDRGQNSERATRSFVVASLIFRRQAALHCEPLLGFKDALWNFLQASGTIPGPGTRMDDTSLMYDSKWLEEPLKYLGSLWCQIHLSLGHSSQHYNKFRVMEWLSTMAFATKADMQVIYTMTAFYNLPDVARINVPPAARFKLSEGTTISLSELKKITRSGRRQFNKCPEASLPQELWESKLQAKERRQRKFQSCQDGAIQDFASALERQWPCDSPQFPAGNHFCTYIATDQVMGKVISMFRSRYENLCFEKYLGTIESTLRSQITVPIPMPSYAWSVPISPNSGRRCYVSIDDIVATPAPSMLSKAPTAFEVRLWTQAGKPPPRSRLETLLARFEIQTRTDCDRDYIEHLRDSLFSLHGREQKISLDFRGYDMSQVLERYLAGCQKHANDSYSALADSAGKIALGSHGVGAIVRHGPRISPTLFLQQLNRRHWEKLQDSWREPILEYALALSDLQRAERLRSLADNPIDLGAELLNVGHQNWKPSKFPETLLLEVESGIVVREVQEEIAFRMRSPPSNANAVMQLNMGEGKSSVIVPIVVASLADGIRLVRVVVAKPQSKQMLQMLISKLGGLLGRRIYHMPFSRTLRLNTSEADSIGRIYRECMGNGGILLVQPEHILSFKLMGLECLITGRESVGRSLLQTQHFFDTTSRDIVDESDENFSVKFELIYTMGSQRPVELSPERWTVIQTVLNLVFHFAPAVKRELPFSIEVDNRWSERCPRIRFLRSDANELILKNVADHICKKGFSGFPVARQSKATRMAVYKYMTEFFLTAEEVNQVEREGDESFWTESTRKPLLLLRGLIAGGVLSFAFGSKRWRVNYGLDVKRIPKTKLAVPFRAKDNPTPRSEFSHPDVVLVLTSLSYYYGGLDDDDLFAAFSHLLKSDQAQVEYGQWVHASPNMPDAFRQLVGININDRFQCIEKVFPHIRYSKGAIDYFLSCLVFPKEMKEFPDKISASGWDIGQIKSHPTTGFSGTNDSRHVLPLAVDHLDLPKQKHTNALVLNCLLQDEHSVAPLVYKDKSRKSDAELLLAAVTEMEPAVRVILDVGAQILELSNLQVATAWLSKDTDNDKTKAAVFFNDSDELSVLDRKGRIELLQTSPFAKQLDLCLVFLDEAHTRGTDLRLPKDYRAAVTLGANLTKDRLVQGEYNVKAAGFSADVNHSLYENEKAWAGTVGRLLCD